jgi:hypothetical protein
MIDNAARKKEETIRERSIDFTKTSLDVHDYDPPFDCERPWYRTKPLTRKDRLLQGF